MTSRRVRTSVRSTARWLMAIGLVVVSVGMPATAHAFWTEDASGEGAASVAALPPVVVTAESPVHSARVELAWSAPTVPSGMAIDGYRVARVQGGVEIDTCGSSPTTLLPSSTLACTDATLDDGSYDYIVTAQVGTWTTTGQLTTPVVVAADRTGPDVALNGVSEDSTRLARRDGAYRLFFRSTAAAGGSLRIDAEVTDAGIGPASVIFPGLAASGWTHAAEEVTSGTGSEPTVTYRSSAFSYATGASTPAGITITGTDDRGNETAIPVTFVDDTTAPTGGALQVNGATATAGGSTSTVAGGFSVDALTAYVEEPTATAAGLDSTTLVRESASLTAGTCGAFGGATVIEGPFPWAQNGLSDGCYRFTLTGVDRVGNAASVSTTVKLDTQAPTGGAVRANGVDAVPGGSTSYDRTGGWALTRSEYSDAQSGLASSTLRRATAPLAAGTCGSWTSAVLAGSPSETGLGTGCVRYTMTGIDNAGNTAEVQTTVLVDRAAPSGGAVVVNGATSSAAGTGSVRTASDVTVTSITAFTDAETGIASSTLVRTFASMTGGVCGTFNPASAITVTGTGVITGLADGCHRFTLTGTDLAGNTSTVFTTVRLDASAPTGGVLTVRGVPGTAAGVMAYAPTSPVAVVWTKFADPESGMTSALLRRTTAASLTNGVCGAFTGVNSDLTTTLTPLTGTSSQSLSTQCYRYVLTGTSTLGVTSTLQVTLVVDTSNPTSTGSLRVNNSTAATSTNTSGTYTVATVRTMADSNSGIVSNVLTRTYAPVAANVCGTFDPVSAVTLGSPIVVPPVITESGLVPGCYRYTQTGTNTVGRTLTATTTVRVDTTAPIGGAFAANGVAATTGTGSTSYSNTGAWTPVRTDFTDPETTLTSTLTRSVYPSLAAGTCGGTPTSATITGAPAESGLTTGCIRYVLTGRNTLNLTAPVLTTTVRIDTSAPVGGVLTVNGSNASTGGTSSTSATGTFSVTALTAMTDANSGLASSTLTRTSGPTCSSIDPASAIVLSGAVPINQPALLPGCYRYTLTGVNNAGLSTVISTSVTVPAPVAPLAIAAVAPTADPVTDPLADPGADPVVDPDVDPAPDAPVVPTLTP